MRFVGEVVAEPVEVLVPVRIFDDHPDAGILLLRGAEHQVARRLAHFGQAVLRPAAVALGGDVGVALHRVEEKVVEDHLVEMARGEARGALALGAVGGVLIVEGAELSARPAAGGERDPTRRLDALRLKLALDGFELGVGREETVAVGLDVDLVELELRGDAGEIPREILRIGQALGEPHRDIDRDAEVLIRRRLGRRRAKAKRHERRQKRNNPLQSHKLPHRLLALPIKRCAEGATIASGSQPKRARPNGDRSIAGGSPLTICVTSSPVIAASVRPRC